MAKISTELKQMQSILKATTTFDKIMNTMDITSLGNGKCTATLKIEEQHTNPMGTLHGGLSATLVDFISSWALLSHEKVKTHSVSVNLNLSYMGAAKEGEEILIEANTLKVGKAMAYLQVFIKNKNNGNTLVKGEHTKYILR